MRTPVTLVLKSIYDKPNVRVTRGIYVIEGYGNKHAPLVHPQQLFKAGVEA